MKLPNRPIHSYNRDRELKRGESKVTYYNENLVVVYDKNKEPRKITNLEGQVVNISKDDLKILLKGSKKLLIDLRLSKEAMKKLRELNNEYGRDFDERYEARMKKYREAAHKNRDFVINT